MYQRQVTFVEAIQMAFCKNYCKFTGRSSRSEYWWFALFSTLVSIVLSVVGTFSSTFANVANFVFAVAFLLPSLGLLVRRFHDIGRSGWWVVGLYVIGIIGAAMAIAGVMMAMDFSENAMDFKSRDVNVPMIIIGIIVAIIPSVITLVWCCKPSQEQPNKWGEVPNLVEG